MIEFGLYSDGASALVKAVEKCSLFALETAADLFEMVQKRFKAGDGIRLVTRDADCIRELFGTAADDSSDDDIEADDLVASFEEPAEPEHPPPSAPSASCEPAAGAAGPARPSLIDDDEEPDDLNDLDRLIRLQERFEIEDALGQPLADDVVESIGPDDTIFDFVQEHTALMAELQKIFVEIRKKQTVGDFVRMVKPVLILIRKEEGFTKTSANSISTAHVERGDNRWNSMEKALANMMDVFATRHAPRSSRMHAWFTAAAKVVAEVLKQTKFEKDKPLRAPLQFRPISVHPAWRGKVGEEFGPLRAQLVIAQLPSGLRPALVQSVWSGATSKRKASAGKSVKHYAALPISMEQCVRLRIAPSPTTT